MKESVITEVYIDRELREMHKKMIELFQFDFPYFKDVIILGESEAEEILTGHIRLNLEEEGVSYTASQWSQIREYLSRNEVGSLFENMAFYDEKWEILYLSRNLLLNHPEKIIPVCVHELAEKLISTLTPSPSVKESSDSFKNLIKKSINSKDPNNRISLEEFLSRYKEVVFKSIFKEGCCEAISLRTLMHTGLKDRVESLEKELIQGHSSISYHLGYPIAKEIIDKHGIEGIKAALKNPPLRAEYFVEPSTYISSLEINKAERR